MIKHISVLFCETTIPRTKIPRKKLLLTKKMYHFKLDIYDVPRADVSLFSIFA
jgi:hypothetical protein